jgi:hypothetical protein
MLQFNLILIIVAKLEMTLVNTLVNAIKSYQIYRLESLISKMKRRGLSILACNVLGWISRDKRWVQIKSKIMFKTFNKLALRRL